MSCRDIPKSLAIWKKHCKGKNCKINVNLHKCNVFVFIRVKKGGCLLAPVSEAKKRANAKYDKKAYDSILVKFPKGTKEKIKETGQTVNGFIVQAVNDKLNIKK